MTDCFAFMYSCCEQFFRADKQEDMSLLYHNLVNILIPTLENIQLSSQPFNILMVSLALCSLLASALFLFIWISISLKI